MFKIGDKVRVKKEVDDPKHSWGGATHRSVGAIVQLYPCMLVDFGLTYKWTADPTEMELVKEEKVNDPRPIKKAEIAGIIPKKRRYKVTKEVDGEFVSVIAGTGSFEDKPILTYETGRVTEAPAFGHADPDTPASGLIFVTDTREQAIADAERLGITEARLHDKRAIFEVLPVGFMRANRKVDGVTMCEAVLVGKKVWENVPAPCEEDITDDIEAEWDGGNIALFYDGELVATITACNVTDVADGYKVEVLPDQTYKVTKIDC